MFRPVSVTEREDRTAQSSLEHRRYVCVASRRFVCLVAILDWPGGGMTPSTACSPNSEVLLGGES